MAAPPLVVPIHRMNGDAAASLLGSLTVAEARATLATQERVPGSLVFLLDNELQDFLADDGELQNAGGPVNLVIKNPLSPEEQASLKIARDGGSKAWVRWWAEAIDKALKPLEEDGEELEPFEGIFRARIAAPVPLAREGEALSVPGPGNLGANAESPAGVIVDEYVYAFVTVEQPSAPEMLEVLCYLFSESVRCRAEMPGGEGGVGACVRADFRQRYVSACERFAPPDKWRGFSQSALLGLLLQWKEPEMFRIWLPFAEDYIVIGCSDFFDERFLYPAKNGGNDGARAYNHLQKFIDAAQPKDYNQILLTMLSGVALGNSLDMYLKDSAGREEYWIWRAFAELWDKHPGFLIGLFRKCLPRGPDDRQTGPTPPVSDDVGKLCIEQIVESAFLDKMGVRPTIIKPRVRSLGKFRQVCEEHGDKYPGVLLRDLSDAVLGRWFELFGADVSEGVSDTPSGDGVEVDERDNSQGESKVFTFISIRAKEEESDEQDVEGSDDSDLDEQVSGADPDDPDEQESGGDSDEGVVDE